MVWLFVKLFIILCVSGISSSFNAGAGGSCQQQRLALLEAKDWHIRVVSTTRKTSSKLPRTVGLLRLQASPEASSEVPANEAPPPELPVPARTAERPPYVPETGDAMVAQGAAAVARAYQAGVVRQTVRWALVPPAETVGGREPQIWTGGPEARLREAAAPLTVALLQRLKVANLGCSEGDGPAAPPSFQAGRPAPVAQADLWNFDGSALATTAVSDRGTLGDVWAGIFLNTDARYLADIEETDALAGPERLFLLVNPAWKDIQSWGFDLLQPRARQRAKALIFERPAGFNYEVTYAVVRFTVTAFGSTRPPGGPQPRRQQHFCCCVKAFPHAWQVYAYPAYDPDQVFSQRMRGDASGSSSDATGEAVRVGASASQPTPQEVAAMIEENAELSSRTPA